MPKKNAPSGARVVSQGPPVVKDKRKKDKSDKKRVKKPTATSSSSPTYKKLWGKYCAALEAKRAAEKELESMTRIADDRSEKRAALAAARDYLASLPHPGPHHSNELGAFWTSADHALNRAISDREFARTTFKLMRSNSIKASLKLTKFLKNPPADGQ